ncbi:hypothetical protein GCK32_015861 [Trichostrongylus colubriformis]|uniref:Uncharacterized protein n=1 Tax=Trichostrongylus colubriformis TaxID=6319 RepID=A0AAN8J0P3_TRICO
MDVYEIARSKKKKDAKKSSKMRRNRYLEAEKRMRQLFEQEDSQDYEWLSEPLWEDEEDRRVKKEMTFSPRYESVEAHCKCLGVADMGCIVFPTPPKNNLFNCEEMNETECQKYYGSNTAMVEVYFEQLNYELIQESEAYQFVNFVADFGGQLGLWLGFSVITVVEVIVLFGQLIRLFLQRRREQKAIDDRQKIAHD